MKKMEPNRYPHSATLFKFCKEALESRYNGRVKVIDQDVGAILGYDPADCSHWKKGKKNIRALSTLRSIADHLNVDERLLIDITSGNITLEEAMFEYKGYGNFNLSGKQLETLKKDFFTNAAKWSSEETAGKSFEELFDIDRKSLSNIVNSILEAGNFKEAPIYLPEVYQLYANLNLQNIESINTPVNVVTENEGQDLKTTIQFRGPEMRPYVRFLVAKEIFKHFVHSKDQMAERFFNRPAEVLEIQANIFAGLLLVPATMLKKEVESIDSSLDIITQLSDIFWVSKSLMNQRLKDYLEFLL